MMQNLDDLKPEAPGQGFQFPGVFEITAVGNNGTGLEARVPAILEGLGLTVLAGTLRTRPSRENHYLSVTVGFTCPTREKHEQAHAALRADPDIRWTL